MFAGFNVMIEDKDKFKRYSKTGHSMYLKHKKIISDSLGQFINPDGSLSQKQIEKNWFQQIHAHVFLSHSHNDIDFVTSFAGWLYEKFRIEAFIDSNVWGNADDLLSAIDREYCVSSRDSNGNPKTYRYTKRNKSTSNVHMILYTALMKMIDQTECLMFMNTPSSLKWSDMLGEESATSSPWIYGEILASRLIRNRSKSAHRRMLSGEILEHADESAKFDIEYTFNTKHLIDITDDDLEEFESRAWSKKNFEALDILYQQKSTRLKAGDF